MAGIYIHIPFCKKKCHYCNFFSTPSQKHRKELVPQLLAELSLRKNYLQEPVSTIYFGGGTPSLLHYDEIELLLESIHANFGVDARAEITMEVNPDDVEIEIVKAWKQTAINRISIGVQSFHAMDLKYLNRVHEEEQSESAIKLLQDVGFDNLSVDLIYGEPSLGMGHWRQNLQKTVGFGVPHISAYLLTVEPNTNLELLIQKQLVATPSEAEGINEFKYMVPYLSEQGYHHYEISNFALPGFEAKHNQSYWNKTPYLGIGPSAHSFNGESRQWNVSNNEMYINSIQRGLIPFEIEILTLTQKHNEYVMTALRTSKGLDLDFMRMEFGDTYVAHIEKKMLRFMSSEWVYRQSNHFYLSLDGMLFSDLISADLFV